MADSDESPAVDFAARFAELGGWRGATLGQIHRVILAADPDVEQAVKWVKPSNPNGVAEWGHAGGICTGEVYKDKVKLTFHKGASLPDPDSVFNSSLDGNVRRAVDFFEDDAIPEAALAELIRAAVVLNETPGPKR